MDKKRDRGVMLFISVLLHGLLALLPWQEPWQKKSRSLAVSLTPVSPISIVDASQLPTLPASESQPAPSSPPAPAVPVSPPADPPWAADAPIPETSDGAEPAPEAAPDAGWTADASIPETSDGAEPAPEAAPDSDPTSVTPADEEAKIAADLEQFVGYLKDQDKGFGFTLFEIFDLFGESEEQVNQFFDENNQPKLDVSSFYHFPEQTPEQVLQTVVMPELTSNTGFDPQPQENVSAGLAYQLLQGEMLHYLIIVRLREGEGSVLMLSESLPGLEL